MLPTVGVIDAIRKLFMEIQTLSNSSSMELSQTKQIQLRALNYVGISYALIYSLILFIMTLFVNIPFAYEHGQSEDHSSFYRWFMVYLYINFLANYVLMWYGAAKSIHCTPRDLPYHTGTSQEDWKKCKQCNLDVPPRTHHCPLCNMCVLKRDHHCFFVGCCIGFFNQRYFICCAFHSFLFCATSAYFMTHYLSAHYVTFLGPEFFKYFLPYAIGVWVFGNTSFTMFLHIIVFYFNVTTLMASIFFLSWQFVLIKNGQTSYELVKGKKTYQSKISIHLRSIFGPFWILNFFFPMPWFQNEGNGRNWSSAGNEKYL
jgi:palmitoyltransferase